MHRLGCGHVLCICAVQNLMHEAVAMASFNLSLKIIEDVGHSEVLCDDSCPSGFHIPFTVSQNKS